MTTLEGTVIGGVRIECQLGQGGMGTVHRGLQVSLQRPVALKVVRANLAEDEEFRARFRREARLAGSLKHPNIVPVHDAGEDDGRPYVVMELLDGIDLASAIRRDGPLSPALATSVVDQIGGALDYAHSRGLIHRDVKPANIMLVGTGPATRAYLTDFGLSKVMGGRDSITVTGSVLGTADYMAPEQFEGESVDGRADTYALGGVLYEALTGEVPFPRAGFEQRMYAHLFLPPPRPCEIRPSLPRAFDEVVACAMAKRPDARFAHSGELGHAARRAATPSQHAQETEVPRRPTVPETNRDLDRDHDRDHDRDQDRRRRRWVLGAVAAAVVALALVATALVVPGGNAAGEIVGSPIPVGGEPAAIDEGGGYVWVGNLNSPADVYDGTLTRIDPATRTTETIPVGGNPSKLVVEGGAVFVANYSDSLTRVDIATGATSSVYVPDGGVKEIAHGNGAVWVTGYGVDTVLRIDARTSAVTPVTVAGAPYGVTVGNSAVYVTTTTPAALVAIDATAATVLGSPLPIRDASNADAVDGTVYVLTAPPPGPDGGSDTSFVAVDERTYVVGPPVLLGRILWVEFLGDSYWTADPVRDEIRRYTLAGDARVGEPVSGQGKGVVAMKPVDDELWVLNAADRAVLRLAPGG